MTIIGRMAMGRVWSRIAHCGDLGDASSAISSAAGLYS
jgi:hypothetical protein